MNKLLKSFAAAAALACGIHVTAAFADTAKISGKPKSKLPPITPLYVPLSLITSQQKGALQEDLNRVLRQNPNRYIVTGDNNHCDMRSAAFLSAPQTLRVLAEQGIRQIFVEQPPAQQGKFDAVANKKAISIYNKHFSSTCGDQIGNEQDYIMADLIRNAQDAGIKVYAADVNNTPTTTKFLLNMLTAAASLDETSPKKVSGRQRADVESKANLFFANRSDDQDVAAFVISHSKNGRSLILRGNGHVMIGGPNSLRENLPSPLALSFYSPGQGWDWITYEGMRQETKNLRRPFTPPEYLINLDTGHIEPYSQKPYESPYIRAILDSPLREPEPFIRTIPHSPAPGPV